MILDVGCGGNPKGDVNCDLFREKSPHTELLIKKCENFVLCDAEFLPFKGQTFDIVHCAHVLEHLRCPLRAVEEFYRVCRNIVVIKIPNTLALFAQPKSHLYGWDKATFTSFLSTVFISTKVYASTTTYKFVRGRLVSRIYILQRFLTFLSKKLLPNELTAVCRR